jgi:hypothetical protein
MPTRTRFAPHIPLAALLAAVVVVAAIVMGFWIRGAGNGLGPGGAEAIPADLRAMATEIEPASPAGKITVDEAIASFERAMGSWDGATITSYLVRMTARDFPAIEDRNVWAIKYDGVEVPFGIPDLPDDGESNPWPNGTPTAGSVLFAFVDAKTGEWLAAGTPP